MQLADKVKPLLVCHIALTKKVYELQVVNEHTDIETSFFGLSNAPYITILYAGYL